MRTTVGPLPPAVYWRRRAVVLGAVLLGIIVLFVSCSGGGKPNQRGKAGSTSLPASGPASSSPDSEPSFADGVPGGGPSLPDPNSLQSQPASNTSQQPGAGATTGAPTGNGTGSNTNVTAPTGGTCADSEISVIPIPAATTVKRGTAVELRLQIKNIGTRTCSRDVGADPQELYLNSGARKYWSSDDCGAVRGNDVRQFAPNSVREYKITWNGREPSTCTGGVASGPTPPAGQYQLRGRLGSVISDPVQLTIVN